VPGGAKERIWRERETKGVKELPRGGNKIGKNKEITGRGGGLRVQKCGVGERCRECEV
jgi:hypothetical protein